MEFLRRAAGSPRSLGILPGAFHPPTRAHLAVAEAGLAHVQEVMFVLPRVFPHKEYDRAGFDQRLALLLAATEDQPRYSVAASQGGLFIEIARECRRCYGPDADLWFLCGRDAAERIAGWDYGDTASFARMLDEFGLLVADRQGRYDPPAEWSERIRRLEIPKGFNEISSTEVRKRVRRGQSWEDLVPAPIVERVRELYS